MMLVNRIKFIARLNEFQMNDDGNSDWCEARKNVWIERNITSILQLLASQFNLWPPFDLWNWLICYKSHTTTTLLAAVFFFLPIAINEKVVYVKCAHFKLKEWWKLIEANGIDRRKWALIESQMDFFLIDWRFLLSIIWVFDWFILWNKNKKY